MVSQHCQRNTTVLTHISWHFPHKSTSSPESTSKYPSRTKRSGSASIGRRTKYVPRPTNLPVHFSLGPLARVNCSFRQLADLCAERQGPFIWDSPSFHVGSVPSEGHLACVSPVASGMWGQEPTMEATKVVRYVSSDNRSCTALQLQLGRARGHHLLSM